MKKVLLVFVVFSFFILSGCDFLISRPNSEPLTENRVDLLDGGGTEEDPYKVSSLSDIYKMIQYQYGYFELQNDISFLDDSYKDDDGLIVNYNETGNLPFKGTFDGAGYSLVMEVFSPLFTKLENASVKNLVIELNSDISYTSLSYYESAYTCNYDECNHPGRSSTIKKEQVVLDDRVKSKDFGIIALMADEDSTIENIYIGGSLNLTLDNDIVDKDIEEYYVGLVVGVNHGTIRNVHVDLDTEINLSNVQSSFSYDSVRYYIGGITGKNDGEITDVRLSKSLQAKTTAKRILVYFGGITEENNGVINRVLVDAELSNHNGVNALINAYGIAYTSGIANTNTAGGSINNVIFRGEITSISGNQNKMSGLVNENLGNVRNAYVYMTYHFSKNWTDVSNNQFYGGLITSGNTNRLINVFYIKQDADESIDMYGKNIDNDDNFLINKDYAKTLVSSGVFSQDDWLSVEEDLPLVKFIDTHWQDTSLLLTLSYQERTQIDESN